MTYGEAYIAEQQSLTMEKGIWLKTVVIRNKAKRLPRAEAGKYYNTKLFAYWLDRLDDSYSIAKKKAVLNYLMFNKPKEKIKFKEKTNG